MIITRLLHRGDKLETDASLGFGGCCLLVSKVCNVVFAGLNSNEGDALLVVV